MIKFGDKEYITDNDLKVSVLGFWPRVDIKNEKFIQLSKLMSRLFY